MMAYVQVLSGAEEGVRGKWYLQEATWKGLLLGGGMKASIKPSQPGGPLGPDHCLVVLMCWSLQNAPPDVLSSHCMPSGCIPAPSPESVNTWSLITAAGQS